MGPYVWNPVNKLCCTMHTSVYIFFRFLSIHFLFYHGTHDNHTRVTCVNFFLKTHRGKNFELLIIILVETFIQNETETPSIVDLTPTTDYCVMGNSKLLRKSDWEKLKENTFLPTWQSNENWQWTGKLVSIELLIKHFTIFNSKFRGRSVGLVDKALGKGSTWAV